MNRSRSDAPPRRSPRQLWWGALFVSSLTAMGSTFEAVRVRVIVMYCIISLILFSTISQIMITKYNMLTLYTQTIDTKILQSTNHRPNPHTTVGRGLHHNIFPPNVPHNHGTKTTNHIPQSQWNQMRNDINPPPNGIYVCGSRSIDQSSHGIGGK